MRYLAFFIAVLVSYAPNIEAKIPEIEKTALLAIAEFIEDGYLAEKWSESEAMPCQWKEVRCNTKQQHVIKLDFSYMAVTELSPQISLLPALEEFNLMGNYLSTLPAEIGQLKALTRLNLSKNQLSILPPEIGQLTSLKSLNVSYNLLKNLPPEIGQLKHLEQLFANSNQILGIPENIITLPYLNTTQLKANWRKATFHANKISEETIKLVQKIKGSTHIDGEETTISHSRSELYNTFVKLKKTATQEELLELVNYPSPAVRGYAFWALTEHQKVDLLPIIKQHFNDNESIFIDFHYLRRTMRIGDFFIKVATYDAGRVFHSSAKKLSTSQLQSLDQMLIKRPNDFYAQNEALLRIKPDPALYARIRYLLIDKHNPAALVALAKYKKEQDIPLIINSFTYTDQNYIQGTRGYYSESYDIPYIAIQSFPQPAFFPFLEKYLTSIVNETHQQQLYQLATLETLYLAIAHYQDSKAKHLLTLPLGVKVPEYRKEKHFKARFCATKEVNMRFYKQLLWSVWEKQGTLDSDVFSYLLKDDPERAFNLTIQSLNNIENFFKINLFLCGNGNNRIPLTNTLLDLALKKQAKWTIDFIADFIKSGIDQYQLTELIITKASKIKDASFISPLFKQLEKQQQYYNYRPLVLALLAYKNEKINKRLKNTLLTHKHLLDLKERDEFKMLFE